MLTAPDHNSHLLSPFTLCSTKKSSSSHRRHSMCSRMRCVFLFPAPFMLSTHNYTSLMPSFMSCFGSTSCSMTLYSTSVLLHPQAPIFHLALSSLQKPESQPTLYILMPQNGMHQLALTHATPTLVPGTSCTLPHRWLWPCSS